MVPFAACVTVTPALVLGIFVALAVIVTDPAVTPVTGTGTLVPPAGTVTVAGTVATAGLLELRLTVRAEAACPERFSIRFCVASALIVRLTGQKLMVVWGGPPEPTWI